MDPESLEDQRVDEVARAPLAPSLPGWTWIALDGIFHVRFDLADAGGNVVFALSVDDGWPTSHADEELAEETTFLSPCCQAVGSGYVTHFCEACGKSYSIQEWPMTSGPVSIQEASMVGALVTRKVFDPLAAVLVTRLWLDLVQDHIDLHHVAFAEVE